MWDLPTKQGTTLYLCLEDSVRRIQKRLLSITDDVPPNVRFCTESSILERWRAAFLTTTRHGAPTAMPERKTRNESRTGKRCRASDDSHHLHLPIQEDTQKTRSAGKSECAFPAAHQRQSAHGQRHGCGNGSGTAGTLTTVNNS